jgi:ABC-type multidrug transport system ATPase subunit
MTQEMTTLPQAQKKSSIDRSTEVVLSTHNLTKRYGSRTVVNNLNLEIHKGDIFGFLGPNGAGKTTSIRMILGLITQTSGDVTILGKNLATHRSQVLPHVGALIETPALYLYMSGRDNLRVVGDSLGGVSAKRIDTVLELVGLAGRQKDKVRTYSLGMKQRLGIAIALLHDPRVVILDEPANGLDPAGIVEMRDLMLNLTNAGKSVLISSHLLSEIQQICTRVAIISHGSLIKETSIKDLTTSDGEYSVQVDNPQEALALVKQQSWGNAAYINEAGLLITQAPEERGRDLNLFLVNAGFVPETLTPAKRDLEQIFLELTDSFSGDVK